MNSGCKWRVENLLVAGRRVSGETFAATPEAAVRNIAARFARDFHADISAAVAGALRDTVRKVFPLTGSGSQETEYRRNHA